MTPTLEIRGLTSGYDGAAVVRDIDITVNAGEVVTLLGANGAGKTTTLQTISGLVRKMGGSILLEGEDLEKYPPDQRARMGIAHVPDGRGVFFGLTVADHFRLGHPGERLDANVAYEYFPALKPIQDRMTGVLSGGEQQMLALGRALARKPRLLLLDELSLGLAPVIVERLLPVVQDYARTANAGVLLVEQHAHLALEFADRGYVLSHGDIVVNDTGQRLRENPDLILASYLGATPENGAEPEG